MVQNILRRYAQMAGIACVLCLILDSSQALDLRKDLSEAQFKAAGLAKLESAELDELQRLIDATPAQPAAAAELKTTKPAFAAAESSPDWRPAQAENSTLASGATSSSANLSRMSPGSRTKSRCFARS